jgi:hypothetical protein
VHGDSIGGQRLLVAFAESIDASGRLADCVARAGELRPRLIMRFIAFGTAGRATVLWRRR